MHKKHSNLSIVKIIPRNESQQIYLESIEQNDITIAYGPPGTAKTLLAIYQGVRLLQQNKFNKIIVARAIVDSPGQKSIGSLPGSYEEKTDVFLEPIKDNMKQFCSLELIDDYIHNGNIEFVATEYLRGRTFNKSFILVEEAQNLTLQSLITVITRIGYGSKIVINGDYIYQKDLSERYGECGLKVAAEHFRGINGIGYVEFKIDDIERNPIIKDIVRRINKVM